VLAIRAFDPGKALVQVTAFKVLSHHLRDYRTVKLILLLEKFVIARFELEKVVIEEFP
jgi:hypothetical protein